METAIQKEINRLNSNKIATLSFIGTPKLLKEAFEISSTVLCNIWNNEIIVTQPLPKSTVNVLTTISEIFETQCAPISLLKNRNTDMIKDYLGGVLMNLFKVFNKINYELLIAKLQHVASEKTSLH